MLTLSHSSRYFLYRSPTRFGIYSLTGLVQNELGFDPSSGDVFVFLSKRLNQIRLLLTEHQRQFDNLKAQLNQSLKENQLIRQKVKSAVQPVHFSSVRQSFMHGLGRSLAPSL